MPEEERCWTIAPQSQRPNSNTLRSFAQLRKVYMYHFVPCSAVPPVVVAPRKYYQFGAHISRFLFS